MRKDIFKDFNVMSCVDKVSVTVQILKYFHEGVASEIWEINSVQITSSTPHNVKLIFRGYFLGNIPCSEISLLLKVF